MNDPYLGFDGPAWWGDATVSKGYDLEVFPGDDGWLPHIEIEHPTAPLTYHFVRSFDSVGVYTPAYAVCPGGLTDELLDVGVYSLPDELPVPTWMPVAIERAGFGYDPVPNSERRTAGKDPSWTPPDQSTLEEVTA